MADASATIKFPSSRSATALLSICVGWASMYGPTYWNLANTLWRTEEQAHGALVLVIVFILFWQSKETLSTPLYVTSRIHSVIGAMLFVVGLVLYVIGRSQDILMFEIGSQMPVITGILLMQFGWQPTRRFWFPILYIAFMIPLPGPLVDALTSPLKQWVSLSTETILYALGYPIARSGVYLSIGQYQLLVAFTYFFRPYYSFNPLRYVFA